MIHAARGRGSKVEVREGLGISLTARSARRAGSVFNETQDGGFGILKDKQGLSLTDPALVN